MAKNVAAWAAEKPGERVTCVHDIPLVRASPTGPPVANVLPTVLLCESSRVHGPKRVTHKTPWMGTLSKRYGLFPQLAVEATGYNPRP